MKTPQHIEVYIDFATIPSLAYLLHFAENYQDQHTIRLFGLSRFEIPQSIIETYPSNIIQYFKIVNHDITQLCQQLANTIEKSVIPVQLTFHLNGFHFFGMLFNLSQVLFKFENKIQQILFNLYDDGSEGIVNLYKIKTENPENLLENIQQDSQTLHQFNSKTTDISFQNIDIARYLWNSRYPTIYHLFSTEILENTSELKPLKAAIKNYNKINLTRYATLNNDQKQLIMAILAISEETLKELTAVFKENNTFLFTGTTSFSIKNEAEQHSLTNYHILLLNNLLNKNSQYYIGDNYLLCIKGHPHENFTNEKLKELYPNALHIPPNIPFEILYMLGCVPKKIGGFASSSYFILPPDHISDVFFFINDSIRLYCKLET